MAGNSIGTLFKITTFGESHGEALGGVIDGCPPNIILDFEAIQNELDRRRPGQSAIDFYQVFLKGKPQVLQLGLSLKMKTNIQLTMRI